MADGAHVEGAALAVLQQALASFADGGRDVLVQAANGVHEVLIEIDERLRFWEADLERTRADLTSCSSYRDEDGNGHDCSAEDAAVASAEGGVETSRMWWQRVAGASEEHARNARDFERILNETCATAMANLQQKAAQVQSYAADSGGSGAGGSPVGSAADASGGMPSLAAYTVNGESFTDVPLSQIETPSFQPGEFYEADMGDMQNSFARLADVRSAVQSGTMDTMAAADPTAKRAFDWFYGGECVKLSWQNGQFTIDNGKHRVAMARALGITHLPAHAWTP